jgi:hypothetical protein
MSQPIGASSGMFGRTKIGFSHPPWRSLIWQLAEQADHQIAVVKREWDIDIVVGMATPSAIPAGMTGICAFRPKTRVASGHSRHLVAGPMGHEVRF